MEKNLSIHLTQKSHVFAFTARQKTGAECNDFLNSDLDPFIILPSAKVVGSVQQLIWLD